LHGTGHGVEAPFQLETDPSAHPPGGTPWHSSDRCVRSEGAAAHSNQPLLALEETSRAAAVSPACAALAERVRFAASAEVTRLATLAGSAGFAAFAADSEVAALAGFAALTALAAFAENATCAGAALRGAAFAAKADA
jgi:hypothetical protein